MQSKEEIATTLDEFSRYSKERKKLRRELLTYIRENYTGDDGWLKFKIRRNFMGDLSDQKVIDYMEEMMRTGE